MKRFLLLLFIAHLLYCIYCLKCYKGDDKTEPAEETCPADVKCCYASVKALGGGGGGNATNSTKARIRRHDISPTTIEELMTEENTEFRFLADAPKAKKFKGCCQADTDKSCKGDDCNTCNTDLCNKGDTLAVNSPALVAAAVLFLFASAAI